MIPRLHALLSTSSFLLLWFPAWVAAQLLAFDFQLDPGDQGQREAAADPVTRRAEIQLLISQSPPFCGWSAAIHFDPSQARYVEGSFVPGPLLYGQLPLVDQPQEGLLEVGGIQADKILASGEEGELGRLQFELLTGVTGPAQLSASALRLQDLETTSEVPVQALATLNLAAPEPQEQPVELLSLGGEEAIAHLTSQRACPGCDLRRLNLAQTDLSLVDLRQAQLQETVLIKADLHQADLRAAKLKGAVLLQADLREAKLQGAELKDARLGGAKMQGADLRGAVMDTLDLQGVNLTGVTWVDGRICGSGSFNRCK